MLAPQAGFMGQFASLRHLNLRLQQLRKRRRFRRAVASTLRLPTLLCRGCLSFRVTAGAINRRDSGAHWPEIGGELPAMMDAVLEI